MKLPSPLLLALAVTALLPLACASKPAAPAQAAAVEPPESELAPRPFTAEQIRDATKPGRTYVWRIETAGQPPVLRRIAFTAVSAEGAKTVAQMLDEQGVTIGPEEPSQPTWTELMRHASFPKAATVVSDAEVEVPAGKFACKLYTITEPKDGHTTVTTVYFPTAFPGAPVKMDVFTDGAAVRTMTLVKHEPGS